MNEQERERTAIQQFLFLDDFHMLEATNGLFQDPDNSHGWWSVAFGYFIGRGFSFSRAVEMAGHAIYRGGQVAGTCTERLARGTVKP